MTIILGAVVVVVIIALSVVGLATLQGYRIRRERAQYLERLARLNAEPSQRAGDGW